MHKIQLRSFFNPIQNGPFQGCSWMGGEGGQKGALLKTCQTYPTMTKLGTVVPYLKKIQNICQSRDIPLEFFRHQYFFTRNQQILLHKEI